MMTLEEARSLFTPYKVWVLAPSVVSDDANIDYYYDFSQSIAEYTRVFEELHLEWSWLPVTMDNFKSTIDTIKTRSRSGPVPLILNLCDGDEVNGAPGVSVIKELVRQGLIFTGADTFFYTITTSKIPMKRAFDRAGVQHAPWRIISGKPGLLKGLTKRIGSPLIIKPAVSGGSMGVSVKNVVHSDNEVIDRVAELEKGYRGWNLLADGLLAELFINGREFTSFITGSADDADACIVYAPVERVFHASLPGTQRFLSFDRLWEIYEEESAMPDNENFYEYAPVESNMAERIKSLSKQAYAACKGKGYGRLDFRLDEATDKLYVLEVNAQCGLSEDENYTSIGAIIKESGLSYTLVIAEILRDALRRSVIKIQDRAESKNVIRSLRKKVIDKGQSRK